MQSENAFSKILVPVDGSAQSVLAQELAALIAKKLKAKVTAIHVVAHPLMHPEMQKLLADYVPVGLASRHFLLQNAFQKPMPALCVMPFPARSTIGIAKKASNTLMKPRVSSRKKEYQSIKN